MRAHFGLPSVEAEDKEGKPPISVKFEIPYFTTSGIQVRYLKIIEKSGYQALPWVRYITQNGGKGQAGFRDPHPSRFFPSPSPMLKGPGLRPPDLTCSAWCPDYQLRTQ